MSSPAPRRAVLLLAAGRSVRFGPADKLAADLGGAPLVSHAARTAAATGCDLAYAVAAADGGPVPRLLGEAGFRVLENDDPDAGQGDSLALGAAALLGEGHAGAVLVVLGDMPFVPVSHLHTLFEAVEDGALAAHSGHGERIRPPAAFAAQVLPALSQLHGDDGARQVVAGLARPAVRCLPARPDWLLDVDTAEALLRARAKLARHQP